MEYTNRLSTGLYCCNFAIFDTFHVMNFTDGTNVVHLGSLGWSFVAWQASFYPAEMPAEWQLTYFNTQFNCVFLEQEVWTQVSPEERSRWHEDTHASFHFLLECDDVMPLPVELEDKAERVHPGDASILWFDRDSSLKELAAILGGRNGDIPRFAVSRDGDLGQIERVATLLEVMGLAA